MLVTEDKRTHKYSHNGMTLSTLSRSSCGLFLIHLKGFVSMEITTLLLFYGCLTFSGKRDFVRTFNNYLSSSTQISP